MLLGVGHTGRSVVRRPRASYGWRSAVRMSFVRTAETGYLIPCNWVGIFRMLSQYYKFSHGLCLNNLLQVLFIVNQRDQVPLFRYIIRSDELSHLVIRGKFLGDMKNLMRSGKLAAEAVGFWTKNNCDVKRAN